MTSPPRPVAILDIETDPFLYGRIPVPFCVGIYTSNGFTRFWGDDCINQSVTFLSKLAPAHIIYAHNGGKFDYMYYLSHIAGNLKIINGRIVSAKMAGHEIRDSYAIMPFPLRDYKKDEIEYWKFERESREIYKSEIIDYLKGDCIYLFDLVTAYHETFGQKYLTVGSTAMARIKEHHPFERTGLAFDRVFRRQFFFGGRVQCFKTGIVEGECSIYDVNSMYPAMMRNVLHPSGENYIVRLQITDDTCFVVARGTSERAFPIRDPRSHGLGFDRCENTFAVTRHEYDAAIDTGTFRPAEIIRTYDFPIRTSMQTFVDYYFDARQKAKNVGDDIHSLLYKFVLNSGYGKYAQNPSNFHDWTLATINDRPRDLCSHCKGTGYCVAVSRACYMCEALNDYEMVDDTACMLCGGDGYRWHLAEYDVNNQQGPMLWKARTFVQSFYNVATGASITGAARATLHRGLALADAPLYCDTDSIITHGSFHGPVGKELGQWKFEGAGSVAAIAGKKLYAIFSDREPDLSTEDRRKYPWMLEPVTYKRRKLWCIKKAHKGYQLSPLEILQVAGGKQIEKFNPAPTFGLFKTPSFISRTARKTA